MKGVIAFVSRAAVRARPRARRHDQPVEGDRLPRRGRGLGSEPGAGHGWRAAGLRRGWRASRCARRSRCSTRSSSCPRDATSTVRSSSARSCSARAGVSPATVRDRRWSPSCRGGRRSWCSSPRCCSGCGSSSAGRAATSRGRCRAAAAVSALLLALLGSRAVATVGKDQPQGGQVPRLRSADELRALPARAGVGRGESGRHVRRHRGAGGVRLLRPRVPRPRPAPRPRPVRRLERRPGHRSRALSGPLRRPRSPGIGPPRCAAPCCGAQRTISPTVRFRRATSSSATSTNCGSAVGEVGEGDRAASLGGAEDLLDVAGADGHEQVAAWRARRSAPGTRSRGRSGSATRSSRQKPPWPVTLAVGRPVSR